MAKLSSHGRELYRAFSPKRAALLAIHEDGVTLYKTPWTTGWKVLSRKKAEISMADWRAAKARWYESLPAWAKNCKSVPSVRRLEEMCDGIAETVDGQDGIEPDGVAINGAPAWPRALGLL